MARMIRPIIEIDEEKCDGCGECVPVCAEGAIRVVDGKARLVAENLCDGIGNCIGICPQGAITVHEKTAEAFDAAAVTAHLEGSAAPELPSKPRLQIQPHIHAPNNGGCPGSQLRSFAPNQPAVPGPAASGTSRLGQWPVQLTLLPATAPLWQDAEVLIAADCVPLAMGDFHDRLLAGKSVAIACPKLDNVQPYVDKLTQIFAGHDIRSVTIAIMEVPCCAGLVQVVDTARARSGKDFPVEVITVTVRGEARAPEQLQQRAARALL